LDFYSNSVSPKLPAVTKAKGVKTLNWAICATIQAIYPVIGGGAPFRNHGKLVAESGVISWLRIQELFRCQSFHQYGVIGSPIVVGLLSIQLIKHLPLRSIGGQSIVIAGKNYSYGIWIGGALFSMGWAITGACPGPLFAQMGSGIGVAAVIVLAALTGT
jgi:uncharacterized membrane protein YedE/YeeE